MKTNLLATIKAENYSGPTPTCTMGQLLASMPKADRDDLLAALADPGIQHTAIVRALRTHGYAVKPTAVPRHRKGECSCEPRG